MPTSDNKRFSGSVDVLFGRRLPEPATPAGYAALIDAFDLNVPPPLRLFAIGTRHRIVDHDGWRLMTPRHSPDPTLKGHLTFALKYEGLDLAVLKRLFLTVDLAELEELVRATPTGSYARRIWFLYEWLTGDLLDLPDTKRGNYVNAVDTDQQYAAEPTNSRRHRVRDNLPGTAKFCPLVRRTDTLEKYGYDDLAARARQVVGDIPPDVLTRAASFLLLEDSRASYAIEGEQPPQDRMQRWGQAIGEAGRRPLDKTELLRLQQLVIGDRRFVRLGIRSEGGFVGRHDRRRRIPIPDHISARPDDLDSLLGGLVEFADSAANDIDPVVAAAVLAFGFVYIHPFEDGNGRIHRYLFHHVLSRRNFHPPGIVFPISSAIQKRIDDYRKVLESYSQRLLPCIDWDPTDDGNVQVTNDTADFYRFFDATPHAEFLYQCVEKTIDEDLPEETEFLRRYDEFTDRIEGLVEMPDNTIDLLFRFLDQNDGRLSKRRRSGKFAALTDDEVREVEQIYADTFGR